MSNLNQDFFDTFYELNSGTRGDRQVVSTELFIHVTNGVLSHLTVMFWQIVIKQRSKVLNRDFNELICGEVKIRMVRQIGLDT